MATIRTAFEVYDMTPATRPRSGAIRIPLGDRRAALERLRVLAQHPAQRRRLARSLVGASADVALQRLASWLAVGALQLVRRSHGYGARMDVEDAGTIVDLGALV